MNKHTPYDLAQMQCLPLETKERMSIERIKIWFESWVKYTIGDVKNDKKRVVVFNKEPNSFGHHIKKRKKLNGKFIEVDVLVKGTKLEPTEYIDFAEDGQVFVSFSGGKDSAVLTDLCARFCETYGYSLYLLFVNTGLEYPEIQKFVKTFVDYIRDKYSIDVQLEVVRPQMRFDEVIKKYGYPVVSKEVSKMVKESRSALLKGDSDYYALKKMQGRATDKNGNKSAFNCEKYNFLLDAPFKISHLCCDVMKKQPSKLYEKTTGRKPIIGTLASESRLRKQQWEKSGCNAFEKNRPTSQPISFWTEQDVLHYIKKYNLPICPVYGEIKADLGNKVSEAQISLMDFIGCYEEADKLKLTGCTRTGCIFCCFGINQEKSLNRFQRLKETHPRQYEYCIGGGEYITEGYAMNSLGEWRSFVFEHDNGTPFTQEEIEEFINDNKDNENFKFVRKWQPSKEGLGLGYVLDYIGVKYD